ncbi:MAG: T9SS type A sorting domain-containing protein [Bacteroidaceae bacterium]|jgi:hypothetical protein|nr:T9SS type A sorting domain-containing protein [Bacteroidaceae bacterium]
MKHFTLALVAMAAFCSQSFAQTKVKNLYTSGTTLNVSLLNNEEQPVQINRTLFAGYNSICLPMSLSAEQLQTAAKGVQVERLISIGQEGAILNLYFLDCTNEGIEAGVPYLIYSPTIQTLRANSTDAGAVSTDLKFVTKTDGTGNQITFGSSWESIQVEGRYGIPALQETDELQSILICTNGDKTFLPTRCGFTWDAKSATAQALEIKHITDVAGEETCIKDLQSLDAEVDIYNVQGAMVQSKANINKAMKTLPNGIYVIKGMKVAINN